ncbi:MULTISPECIES: S8 family peptidase [Halorussus]|uniref:S8 family peptidase n=1 Tax=Halorussus TaxID=1070314 RepID=UPI000E21A410|nr:MULTISPECIES: S8 family peptidase [Halorussus]NHN58865.1 S8 family peptidase [Halorussus sp. JP-T4]
MSDNDNGVSRRNVLKGVGASVATAAAGSGLAAAEPDDSVEVNVGFSSARGRQVAVQQADETVRVFNSIDAVTVRLPKRAATALERNPNIRYVEENGTMEAFAQTLPWGVDRVDAEVAHAEGETGEGADIAIVDTGIDDDHPDLQANVGAGESFVSCGSGGLTGNCTFYGNSNDCNESWSDDNDHGTHCAGIADAVNDAEGVRGVSTRATLHAVKVLDCAGSGTFSDIAAGVEYVADQGWDVASLSLGGDSGSQTLKDAVEYATNNGVFVAVAAGNPGPCTDCVKYPAKYEEVVAVSATNQSDELAEFSAQGPEVDIAAPGAEIYSTVPGGYDTYDGTSMACPHVAGAAGQLMANGLSNAEARDELESTAEDIGLSSNEQGHGLLDAAAALGFDSSDN